MSAMYQKVCKSTPVHLHPIVCNICKSVLAYGEIKNGEIAIKCTKHGCKNINYIKADMPIIGNKDSLLYEIMKEKDNEN